MRADDLLFEVESNSGECVGVGRGHCAERIRALALDLTKIDPKSERSVILNARLLLADGQAAKAQSLLDATCPSLEAPDCWLWRVIVVERLNAPEQQLAEAMDVYLAAACTSALPCATAASGLGDRLMNQGRWAAAVRMYDRAARESRDPAAWQRLAAAAQRAGLDSVAFRALTRAKGGRPAADVPALGGLEDLERTKSPSPRTSGR
jgi:tetratricopeptide (TPR) repeat protein